MRALFVACALAAGCFSGAPADGVWACGPEPSPCPPGFLCGGDGRCHAAATLASCADGAPGDGESDVDCGGRCPRCEVGRACASASDCATDTCVEGRCALASGPPFWLPVASLPHARARLALAAVPDGTLVALGGSGDVNPLEAWVERYLPEEDRWVALPSLKLARTGAAAGAGADGRLYAAGGDGQPKRVEVLAPGEADWRELAEAPAGFANAGYATATVAALGERALFVVGGLSGDGSTTPLEAAWRRPLVEAASFSAAAPLPTARARLALCASLDGVVWAMGGERAGAPVATVERYAILENAWTAAPPLPVATSALAAAAGADGRVYALGGRDPAGAPTDAAWALGPDGRWSPLPRLGGARAELAAVTGADGRVYAAGGRAAATLDRVEAYGPRLFAEPGTPAGPQVTLRGANFAANARVELRVDDALVAATITTAADGTFAGLVVPLPAASGAHTLVAVDHRSRYPARLVVTLP